MRFMHRFRRPLSLLVLTGLMLSMTSAPAAAEYDPKTGRWLQRDPNGMGVVLQPGLPHHAANPTVTVSMAYQLQYAHGMNFYEFVRSNPGNRRDPSGQFSLPDLLTTTTIQATVGGFVNGVMAKFAGRSFMKGFIEGAASGALGGGFGFAASRFGFAGRLLFSEFSESVVENVGRAAIQGDDITDAMVQGVFEGSVGLVTGGAIDLGAARLGNPKVLSAINAGGVSPGRRFLPFTQDNFRANMTRYWGVDPPGYHAHHMFPIKHADKFQKAGVDIHNPIYGAWWQADDHLEKALEYGARWDDFFVRNLAPGADEVLEFGRQLAKGYDLSITY